MRRRIRALLHPEHLASRTGDKEGGECPADLWTGYGEWPGVLPFRETTSPHLHPASQTLQSFLSPGLIFVVAAWIGLGS
jgi:hypothetical protein